MENDTGRFGADKYPEYQHCSWSITVKHGLEVFLEFTSMDIPDCSENQLEIYDGVDNTGSLLATYCADNATSGNTLRSTGNSVYVMLKSGNSNAGSVQFQARYEAEDPITGNKKKILNLFVEAVNTCSACFQSIYHICLCNQLQFS